jgi:hypothetical protein
VNPRQPLPMDPETPHREYPRPIARPRASKEGSLTGNNVTLKLVGISATVAVVAFTVGGWVGDLRATNTRHDNELRELREIARDLKAMVVEMKDANTQRDARVKSLEEWRTGPRTALPIPAPDGR